MDYPIWVPQKSRAGPGESCPNLPVTALPMSLIPSPPSQIGKRGTEQGERVNPGSSPEEQNGNSLVKYEEGRVPLAVVVGPFTLLDMGMTFVIPSPSLSVL